MNKTCQKILNQIATAKDNVLGQFRDVLAEHESSLRLALNEAEALAWETQYPELVFQDLAEEKARGVMDWIAHQRLVRPRGIS
ncbi:MAG TPA: hypothetical protein VH595_21995 [Verrucomicrobiae bacterium]|nr:hypothetical protein [Verrucomicrobiae bacterium]